MSTKTSPQQVSNSTSTSPSQSQPSSQSTQQKKSHYQRKRDSILTNLNQSSFVNGSQYALLLVSPDGQVETYASSALEPNLSRWFGNEEEDGISIGISQEAKNIVGTNALKSHMEIATPPLKDSRFQNISSSSASSPNSPSNSQIANGMVRPATVGPVVVVSRGDGDEENIDVNGENSSKEQEQQLGMEEGTMKLPRGKKRTRERPVVAPIDMNVVNQSHLLGYQRDGLLSAGGQNPHLPSNSNVHHHDYPQPPHSAPLPIHHHDHHDRSPMMQMGMPLENPDTPTVGTMPLHHPYDPMQEILLPTHNDRSAFFELRLQQMQSVVCKTIAKAWIKVIEPKKQSYHPYKLGEAAKPAWWPAGSRHREPDHLFLPERKNLIIGLLRSPHTNISALQTATAEIPSRIIRPDKAALLMDVYAVAREEENMRYSGADIDTPMRIRVSTLDGWNPDAYQDPSASNGTAMEKSKSMGPAAPSSSASTASNSSRKRPSPPAMSRSVSDGRKRQALDSASSSTSGDQSDQQLSASQAQAAAGLVIDANSQWRWQQQAGPSMSTPVRQTSQILHGSEPRSQGGYYSDISMAPMTAQIPYANLYPLGSPFGPQAQAQQHLLLGHQHQHHTLSSSPPLLQQHRGSLSTPFSFAPLPQTNEDLHHHQQQQQHQHQMLHSSPEIIQQSQENISSGALGLHGIENGPQESQSMSLSQSSSHHHDHDHLLRGGLSNLGNGVDNSSDLTFDSNYDDSYLSSNGPRTPTPGRTPSPGPIRPFGELDLNDENLNDASQQPQSQSHNQTRRRGISAGSNSNGFNSNNSNNGIGSKEELDRIQQQLDSFEWNQHGLIQHGTLA